MASNLGLRRRVGFLMKLVLLGIACTLAVFLGGLGSKVLDDLSSWYRMPDYQEFEPAGELQPLEAEREPLQRERETLSSRRDEVQQALSVALRRLQSEQQSYQDWLQARKTIGSPADDPEVRTRLKELDRLRQVEEGWRMRLDQIGKEEEGLIQREAQLAEKLAQVRRQQEENYAMAMRAYDLKIFLIRLAVVGPLLLAAILLFFKRRSSPYWPLVWGFILFALYEFFVGLVPYLPSYGGYVRYAVGIVLTLILGWYLTRTLLRLAEKWKRELSETMMERARKIGKESAWKAHQKHRCPACEKDFLLGKWRPAVKLKEAIGEEEAPDFCPHCGLRLFDSCPGCKTRYFIHFSFCPACGASSLTTPGPVGKT